MTEPQVREGSVPQVVPQVRPHGAGWRRWVLGLVTLGALAVSIRGQAAAVAPLLPWPMNGVFALTNDIAAVLALDQAVNTRRPDVRRWAWVVIVLAGGGGAALNAWCDVAAGLLPWGVSLGVGLGPVVLAAVLSHLVALVVDEARVPQVVPQVVERPQVQLVADLVASQPQVPAAVEPQVREGSMPQVQPQVVPQVRDGAAPHVSLTKTPRGEPQESEREPQVPARRRAPRTPTGEATDDLLLRRARHAIARADATRQQRIADGQRPGRKYGRTQLATDLGVSPDVARRLLETLAEQGKGA